MAASEPTGLMAFWAEIDGAYLDRFREWHNCEHMPERVSIPGFVGGRRYFAVGDSKGVLMMYETVEAAVLASPPYMERLNAPTPWTKESLPHFGNPSRNIYSLVAGEGASDFVAAPYMISVRFNGEVDAEIVVALRRAGGVGRVRLYAIDEAISGIETSERAIYGGGPGQQQWLLLIEAASPSLDAAREAAAGWRDVFVDSFAVEYVLAAPGGGG
ncbi:MAG: hypothetical protein RIM84_14230 [Alphaproteobacteria bacterium]